MTTNHELFHAVRANFIHKVSYLAKHTGRINLTETPNYIRVDSGLPSDTFNVTVLLREDVKESDTDIIEEAVHYFTKKKFPMALWSWEDRESDTFETLRKMGLKEAEINVAMYADLDTLHPDTTDLAEFRMKEVSTPAEVKQYGNLLATLFGQSEEATHVRAYYQYVSELPLLNNSAIKFYIGMFQNEVVSTGSLIFTEDSVGIYDIATLPEFRGKGFGSAMFHFLLTEAKKQNATCCVLQASPDGLNIYKRAGFEPVCQVAVYENRHLIDLKGFF